MVAGRKIKVLIVDDSIMFRTSLQRLLNEDPRIEVIATAMDSYDAMEKIREKHPDVVTLDVEMPRMNGIDFLKKLMPVHPVPVVVVSSAPIRVLDALDAGAVDFVRKPTIKTPADMSAFVRELTGKIQIASTAHVGQRRLASPTASVAPATSSLLGNLHLSPSSNTVIAIGASTGGTEAILAVVKDLPANTPGVIIVQHMPPVFTNMYAQRLDKICKMSVKEAANNDRVEKGRILIAAGDAHMRLASDSKGYYVKCAPGPKVSGHCPSVDVMFESVAGVAGRNAVGVILTGMGADGAKGLLQMKKNGAYTIGQNKESCVVYGMPMVSFNIGAVTKQLPLDAITGELIRYLNTHTL